MIVLCRYSYEVERTREENRFHIFESKSNGELSFHYSLTGPEIELVDFDFSTNVLWTTGFTNGQIGSTQFSRLALNQSVSDVNNWKSVATYQESLLEEDNIAEAIQDLSNAFLERIFYPGRFPNSVLFEAIERFVLHSFPEDKHKSVIPDQLNSFTRSEIRSFMVHVVQLQNPGGFQYSSWKLMLEFCKHSWAQFAIPIGIYVNPHTGLPILISNLGAGLVRESSVIEELYSTMFEKPDDDLATQSFGYLIFSPEDRQTVAGDFNLLVESAEILTQLLGSENLNLLDEDLFYSRDTSGAFTQQIHSLYQLGRSFQPFYQKFKQVHNPISVLGQYFRWINRTSVEAEEYFVPVQISRVGQEILAFSLEQVLRAHYIVLRNMILLLFFLARVRNHSGLDSAQLESIQLTYIPIGLKLLRAYHTLRWLSLQTCDPVQNSSNGFERSSSLNEPSSDKGLLVKYFEVISIAVSQNEQDAAKGLILRLIYAILPRVLDRAWCMSESNSDLAQTIANRDRAVSLARFLDSTGQYRHLREYVRLIGSHSKALALYLGKAYLHFQQVNRAADCFLQAIQFQFENRGAPQTVEFCYQILDLLDSEAVKPNHQIVNLAYTTLYYLNIAKQEQGKCWARIFNASVEQLDFEMAYLAMTNASDDMRSTFLQRLVSVLCQNGRLDLLCDSELSFPWSGIINDSRHPIPRAIVNEVDEILQRKAQQADIIEQPNYYQILYSFHCLRGNYVKGKKFFFHPFCLVTQNNCAIFGFFLFDIFSWPSNVGLRSTFTIPSKNFFV